LNPNIKKDILASVVVFLVALPLSLGIALASGAPIIAGVIAAAMGGIVAGLLGGAPLQVSGPAAGLTVIVYGVVQQFGWQTACLITLLAGLIQLALGFSKVARAALAISPAVVHGMLAGIGVTIAVAQAQVVLGGAPSSGVLKNLAKMPEHLSAVNPAALMLGVLSIAVLVLWPKLPKSVQAVPAPLVAVVVPTLLSVFIPVTVKRIDLPENLLGALKMPVLPEASQFGAILMSALIIALVASVESLLCAVATDKLHNGKRADLDKELIGQGAANALSGLVGGLPITGVIVRSSANVNAGATSRVSAILHGVWILVCVLLVGGLLEFIPLAALAGLLVHVGIKLVNLNHIKELREHRELPVYLVTLFGVVVFDLIMGVGFGLALSLFMVLRRMATTQIRVETRADRTWVFVNGTMTFMNVPKLVQTLNAMQPGQKVNVEIHTDFMDHAAFEALHTWENTYTAGGGEVFISETYEPWYEQASQSKPQVHKSLIVLTDRRLAQGTE
jgi:carbonic anhydrase